MNFPLDIVPDARPVFPARMTKDFDPLHRRMATGDILFPLALLAGLSKFGLFGCHASFRLGNFDAFPQLVRVLLHQGLASRTVDGTLLFREEFRLAVAEEVAKVVREKHITQVVFGRSAQTGWRRYLYLSVIHKFLRDAPPVDVHIVTQEVK